MFYVARPAAYSERRPRAGQARAGQGRAGQRRVIGFVEGREELSSMRGDHLEVSRIDRRCKGSTRTDSV